VDALCINQTDVSERNQQIRQMSSVYRSSNLTLIWLGPKTEADAACIAMLDQFDEIEHNPSMSMQERHEAALKVLQRREHFYERGYVIPRLLPVYLHFVCEACQET
jgi:hypothetical protein